MGPVDFTDNFPPLNRRSSKHVLSSELSVSKKTKVGQVVGVGVSSCPVHTPLYNGITTATLNDKSNFAHLGCSYNTDRRIYILMMDHVWKCGLSPNVVKLVLTKT